MTKRTTADKLKRVFILAYFLILSVERIISLVTVFMGDISKYDALDWYMTALTLFAVFGAYVYIATKWRVSAHDSAEDTEELPLTFGENELAKLAIAAGILLFGGMVHTNGSIPAMQFAAYGMLLAAMAIHTFQCAKKDGGALLKWLSFAYVTAYSMSIPVVYHTNIQLKYLFIPIECVVSAGMVVLFTIMLKRLFTRKAENNFSLIPFLVAVFGDFAVIILRWSEEINWFVLIFICIASALWFVTNILCMIKKK